MNKYIKYKKHWPRWRNLVTASNHAEEFKNHTLLHDYFVRLVETKISPMPSWNALTQRTCGTTLRSNEHTFPRAFWRRSFCKFWILTLLTKIFFPFFRWMHCLHSYPEQVQSFSSSSFAIMFKHLMIEVPHCHNADGAALNDDRFNPNHSLEKRIIGISSL